MITKLLSLFAGKPQPPKTPPTQYVFRWYDVGPDNPFGVRILDVRSFTGSIIATTSNPTIAKKYNALRGSDGKDLISAEIQDACTVRCELHFAHNGASLSGIVFKADSMDVKWDIYIYENVFYFARSWTGELMFKATALIAGDSIVISEIQCRRQDAELAPSHVFFLLGSHALGRVLPHRLPVDSDIGDLPIATLSFNLFGNRGCYAAFDDIIQISLETKKT